MATRYDLMANGIGGGTPPAPRSLDPRGLVPVNRAQPLATDNLEPQRIMERRTGAMPPSSFSGAGAGFVPVDRTPPQMAAVSAPGGAASPTAMAPSPVVSNYAERLTDAGPQVQTLNTGVAPTGVANRAARVADALGVPGQDHPRSDTFIAERMGQMADWRAARETRRDDMRDIRQQYMNDPHGRHQALMQMRQEGRWRGMSGGIPENWATMSPADKLAWVQANRPGVRTGLMGGA